MVRIGSDMPEISDRAESELKKNPNFKLSMLKNPSMKDWQKKSYKCDKCKNKNMKKCYLEEYIMFSGAEQL